MNFPWTVLASILVDNLGRVYVRNRWTFEQEGDHGSIFMNERGSVVKEQLNSAKIRIISNRQIYYLGIGLHLIYVRLGSLGSAQKNPWSCPKSVHRSQVEVWTPATHLHSLEQPLRIHLQLRKNQILDNRMWSDTIRRRQLTCTQSLLSPVSLHISDTELPLSLLNAYSLLGSS